MLDWLRRRLSPKPEQAVPVAVEPHDPIADLRDYIFREVAGGFADEDAILRGAADMFEDEIDAALLRRESSNLLREALAGHRAAELSWPERTDCDRLDEAFAALEADGVISRQNFSCCGTCGASEIWDEIAQAEAAGGPARGYAFFHMQDTESALEGYGLYLNYGACEEGESAAVAVGHDIVAQLNASGLDTDWDGTLAHRISVSLDWKRRRPASEGFAPAR